MSERAERARYLGEQLRAVMDALGEATRGPDVVVFLDRLARLEAYPDHELTQVPGLAELVREAARARDEHADELARVAGRALDLERLLDAGRHLPTDDPDNARDAWLHDVLTVATVAPWLTAARRRQAAWALDRAHALLDAEAEAFLDASVVASDRHALEAPEGLGAEARGLVRALLDLPLAVAFARTAAPSGLARLDAALARVDPAWLDAADDALADQDTRGALRLPGARERAALAASDAASAVLLRMEAGAWVVTRRGGDLRLAFEGDATEVAVEVDGGAAPGALRAEPDGSFLLPRAPAGLDLRLRVGPDSRAIRFAPPQD